MKKFYFLFIITFNSFEVFCQDIFSGGESSDFGFIELVEGDDLPIDLAYFKANLVDNQVAIEWSTATEINNSHFVIEKSSDKTNWFELAVIEGNGNSNTTINYSYTDQNITHNTVYYRLKQVDFDGQFKYYQPAKVSFDVENLINVYPNPSTGVINIATNFLGSSETLSLYSSAGQELQIDRKTIISDNQLQLNLSHLESGVYFLKVNGFTKRIMIQ
ncbi:T9SS type A sorting domain-containing protein [Flammeovirga yaeyamensis]|uniref:T9SS type A sorting domain-containing protein n=1 Tax=Flammeovirga yaeyamensis TaxID=367791 RepID=A0AAX1N829_9BACT|nr:MULTISPECIES: T9SS type A sorting domain-containing protein [Flammeovirga]ANQ50521.1 T9SS type A sorting domain-containing protein [Flammeovirga sp. MY04]MBB3700634.1 hypothetical protein [Flammeovirga yaeyamensis]NMF37750.1 T9SS type A sorting domain-containing protein [Flammeovirga yaeyamensis]QWG02058.1 T9SS type A sorting domain-containing protein [Flammeovirga yaeyamensis]